jgi:hypothetical protein
MSIVLRGLVVALLFVFAGAGGAAAQGGELSALSAWVAKSQQKSRIDGRVAKALGLSQDGKPIEFVAVTTAYLDGSRTVHLVAGPQGQGQLLLFSQGKANQGTWILASTAGAMMRAVQWVPTSANPQPADAAATTALFNETKKFWKDQLGKPVR